MRNANAAIIEYGRRRPSIPITPLHMEYDNNITGI